MCSGASFVPWSLEGWLCRLNLNLRFVVTMRCWLQWDSAQSQAAMKQELEPHLARRTSLRTLRLSTLRCFQQVCSFDNRSSDRARTKRKECTESFEYKGEKKTTTYRSKEAMIWHVLTEPTWRSCYSPRALQMSFDWSKTDSACHRFQTPEKYECSFN